MAMLNIPTSVDDPAYRYKMPRLISKKEGRGNGSKTCIMNMSDVSGALKRKPEYCAKFFGFELGAQTNYTNKEGEGERTIINGHHETKVFQDLLDKFIDKYVLCQNCNLPEIDMVVKKGNILATCKACGWSGELDSQHRVANYIVKNPPDTGIGFDADTSKKVKASREERQKARLEAKKKAEEGDDDDEDDDDEDAPKKKKDKKEKKDKKDKKEKKEKKSKKENDGSDDEDDDEEKKEKKERKEKKDKKDKKEKKDKKDKKEKKAKKEKKDKDSDSDKSDDDSDKQDEDAGETKYGDDALKGWITDMIAWSGKQGKLTPQSLQDELRPLQVTLRFDNSVRMFVVLSILFKDGSMDAKGITAQKAFVKYYITNGNLDFDEWIWGFDAFLDTYSGAVKGYPMVLKALYDEDLADEKDLLRYYRSSKDNPGFDAAAKAAAPFLKWLETADDDDSDDSGSGSGSDSDSD
jgi:translation initiation factor 5